MTNTSLIEFESAKALLTLKIDKKISPAEVLEIYQAFTEFLIYSYDLDLDTVSPH